MNKCIFTGNLTRAPEFRTSNSGIPRCSFCIAVQSRFRNPEGEYDVDFIEVVTWRSTADFCNKHLSKGARVIVVGSLKTNSYVDRNGQKRVGFNIQADEVEISSLKKEEAPQIDDVAKAKLPETTPIDEELPF